ncbi:MAG: hypothetical protein LBP59_08195 [Planctomycetaceae bacterium]|jgi:hypothetical protein|nr:hypothetical protein [Planctomycetaceae bacterium]
MKKIDLSYLYEIVYSSKTPEEKYYKLVEAARTAKDQGMSRRETGDLFGKLWDIDDSVEAELDGYISSVLEIIYGYCLEQYRIWPGAWDERKGK